MARKSDASISTVAKRARNRARRMTAGQMPGRYHGASRAASIADCDTEHMHYALPSSSPPSSMHSAPSSPRPCDPYCTNDLGLRGFQHLLNIDEPSPYPFPDPAVDSMFPELVVLGLGDCDIDGQSTSAALALPAMAADPSSAERFSFSDDAVFNSDAFPVIDSPDHRTALISLVRDRARTPGRLYYACVRALAQLGSRLIEKSIRPAASCGSECRLFVRAFAAEHMSAHGGGFTPSSGAGGESVFTTRQQHGIMACRLMLPERAAYETAVDALRAMFDCTYLAIFPEELVLQLLEDDVSELSASSGQFEPSETERASWCSIMQREPTDKQHAKHIPAQG
jgi:hypothetical protein